jgi:hypothetical protein
MAFPADHYGGTIQGGGASIWLQVGAPDFQLDTNTPGQVIWL